MINESSLNTQRRVVWLATVYGLLGMVLLGGLFTRQILQYEKYRSQEERQSVRRVLIPAPRGVVYDRNGEILINNKPRFSLIVYLGEMRKEFRKEQIEQLKRARAKGLEIDRQGLMKDSIARVLKGHLQPIERYLGRNVAFETEKIEKHINQKPLMPYTLLSNLTLDEFARLTEILRVDAPIQLKTDSVRTYPKGELAPHTLGFVSMREPESDDEYRTFSFKGQEGVSGVEKTFEETLAGKTGYELWVVDPSGFRYEPKEKANAIPGKPITLTLDSRLQRALEKSFGSKIGAAAALDVNTGEVLALCSKPSYDPNDLVPFFTKETDARIRHNNGWLNRAIQGLYPPGSTFKIITALAAFENGQLDLHEEVNCPGYYMVGNRRFPCNRQSGHGSVEIIKAIEKSCNVFFYVLGLRTGPGAIVDEGSKFGLDRPTGIELPGETRRMVLPTPQWKRENIFDPWYAGDTANMSIGQGYVLVTPLQMACMTASLARGQYETTPTLLKKDNPQLLGKTPLSEARAKILEGMKAAATTGTARLVEVDGLKIAAKTGTAQVVSRGVKLTLAWFVGFAPADDPEVAISVVVEGTNPDDEYAGGTTAAPIARSFLEKWLEISQADNNPIPLSPSAELEP